MGRSTYSIVSSLACSNEDIIVALVVGTDHDPTQPDAHIFPTSTRNVAVQTGNNDRVVDDISASIIPRAIHDEGVAVNNLLNSGHEVIVNHAVVLTAPMVNPTPLVTHNEKPELAIPPHSSDDGPHGSN